jgi:hypothetical protein
MLTCGTEVSAGCNSAVGTTRHGFRTPVREKFSLPLGDHPASCTSGTVSLYRGSSSRTVPLTTTPSSASAPSWPVTARTLHLQRSAVFAFRVPFVFLGIGSPFTGTQVPIFPQPFQTCEIKPQPLPSIF